MPVTSRKFDKYEDSLLFKKINTLSGVISLGKQSTKGSLHELLNAVEVLLKAISTIAEKFSAGKTPTFFDKATIALQIKSIYSNSTAIKKIIASKLLNIVSNASLHHTLFTSDDNLVKLLTRYRENIAPNPTMTEKEQKSHLMRCLQAINKQKVLSLDTIFTILTHNAKLTEKAQEVTVLNRVFSNIKVLLQHETLSNLLTFLDDNAIQATIYEVFNAWIVQKFASFKDVRLTPQTDYRYKLQYTRKADADNEYPEEKIEETLNINEIFTSLQGYIIKLDSSHSHTQTTHSQHQDATSVCSQKHLIEDRKSIQKVETSIPVQENKIPQLTNAIVTLQEKITQQTQTAEQLEAEISSLTTKISEENQKIAAIQSEHAQLKENYNDKTNKLNNISENNSFLSIFTESQKELNALLDVIETTLQSEGQTATSKKLDQTQLTAILNHPILSGIYTGEFTESPAITSLETLFGLLTFPSLEFRDKLLEQWKQIISSAFNPLDPRKPYPFKERFSVPTSSVNENYRQELHRALLVAVSNAKSVFQTMQSMQTEIDALQVEVDALIIDQEKHTARLEPLSMTHKHKSEILSNLREKIAHDQGQIMEMQLELNLLSTAQLAEQGRRQQQKHQEQARLLEQEVQNKADQDKQHKIKTIMSKINEFVQPKAYYDYLVLLETLLNTLASESNSDLSTNESVQISLSRTISELRNQWEDFILSHDQNSILTVPSSEARKQFSDTIKTLLENIPVNAFPNGNKKPVIANILLCLAALVLPVIIIPVRLIYTNTVHGRAGFFFQSKEEIHLQKTAHKAKQVSSMEATANEGIEILLSEGASDDEDEVSTRAVIDVGDDNLLFSSASTSSSCLV